MPTLTDAEQIERLRRHRATMDTYRLFQDQPGRWIHWKRFARIAACAWRTRVSEARQLAKQDGGSIEWNRRVKRSAYRYLPYQPLGRDAATDASGQRTFSFARTR